MSRFRFVVLLAVVAFAITSRPAKSQDKDATEAPLVTRGRIQLNLAGAETILTAARHKSVVDEAENEYRRRR